MSMPMGSTNPLDKLNYLSNLKKALDLNDEEVKVERTRRISWGNWFADVYEAGGIKKIGSKIILIVGNAYHGSSTVNGEFDEHGQPIIRKKEIKGKYNEDTLKTMVELEIKKLGEKTDCPWPK